MVRQISKKQRRLVRGGCVMLFISEVLQLPVTPRPACNMGESGSERVQGRESCLLSLTHFYSLIFRLS